MLNNSGTEVKKFSLLTVIYILFGITMIVTLALQWVLLETDCTKTTSLVFSVPHTEIDDHPVINLEEGKYKFWGNEILGIWWGFERGDLRWGG